jgi:cytochrome c
MKRRPTFALLLLSIGGLGLVLDTPPARGDGSPQQEEAKARARGQEIWTQRWGVGSKACAECHADGPNKMRAMRLKSYPKYDKVAARVITGQEKLRQMIETQSKGTPFELGSADLTALEAFVGTLR